MHHRYIRGLFEPKKYNEEKFKHINPITIPDAELLDMICEITGMSEPEVIEEAIKEIRLTRSGFSWNFNEYFRDMKLELHPLIRNELRRAHFVLHDR